MYLMFIGELSSCSSRLARTLAKPPGHGGEQLRTDIRPRPRAIGNTNSAPCRLSEVGDAFIEVHIPTLHSAHHLLVFGDGAWRARPRAYLAALAEFVASKNVGPGGHQRHIRGHASQTHARSELPADYRAVLTELAQT
jgi:hypothetical protein